MGKGRSDTGNGPPGVILLGLFWLAVWAWSPCAATAADKVNARELATDPGWLKLGHYQQSGLFGRHWRSAIHSPEFFLDAGGRDDPERELRATLAAFAQPAGEEPDAHARCRFPARWLWLKRRLGSEAPAGGPERCPAFDRWTRRGHVASVSIVLATGFLGNPASYYGHTLLKFNFDRQDMPSRLIDVSVNYGAIVERDDGVLTYILKSLTGGYDGGFSHIGYYFHNHNYGEIELRDLWEYELALPSEAVEFIVAHAWEVLGKRYTYYFFRENCSFRMAELLEIVEGVQVVPDVAPWVIPQAILQQLGRSTLAGRPLVERVTYHPSRQARFYEKYRNLSESEVRLVESLVRGQLSLEDPSFLAQTVPARQKVLDALLDYYQFVGNPLEKAPAQWRSAYELVLAKRFELDPGSPQVTPTMPSPPHRARPAGWVQGGARLHGTLGDGLSLRVRPAYYDRLDGESGHVRNAALLMGDTEVSFVRGRARLIRLDAVGVESVPAGLTGLPGDDPLAWRLHAGVESARLYCDDCLVARVQGDIGKAFRSSEALLLQANLGGALQNRRRGQGVGFLRPSLDLIARAGAGFAMKVGVEYRLPIGADAPASYVVSETELRWQLSRVSDLRVRHQHDRSNAWQIGFGYYW